MPAIANLGIRAPDIDAERWFLEALGGRALLHGRADRWHLMLGDTRLVLFRRAPYDDALDRAGMPTSGGLAHVAFDVAPPPGVVPLVATLEANVPALPDMPPMRTGPCRVTFYRSPGGAVFETQDFTPQGGVTWP